MDEQTALDRYLNPPWIERGFTIKSSFWGALIDARQVTGRGPDTGTVVAPNHTGTWLGAIGYLTFLDQVGTAVQPKGGSATGHPIRRALTYFADPPLTDRDLDAVYALRCSLAHDFSLINNPSEPHREHLRFRFALYRSEDGWLVSHGAKGWKGPGDTDPDSQTQVNLWRLGDVAEQVAKCVIELHGANDLAARLPPDELIGRYTIVYLEE